MADVISCVWDIYINGKQISENRYICITEISIDEICDGSDTCTITLQDPDFAFIEDNIFVEEASIKVTAFLNNVKDSDILFEGYISAIDISFPEDGYPTMSLYCLDKSHVMNRTKKTRSWDNTTSASVVQQIAQEYGYKCVIQQGYNFKTQDTISQSKETDIAFIESLADNESDIFMCKLIGDTIYYIKKGLLDKPVSELAYREYPYSVMSFSPKINKETRQEEITNSDIGDDKTTETATADEDTPRDTQGESVKTSSGAMQFSADDRKWGDTAKMNQASDGITDFTDSIDWSEYE